MAEPILVSREWRSGQQGWGREVWTYDQHGLEYCVRVNDVPCLVALRIPELPTDCVTASLTKAIVDQAWIHEFLSGVEPVATPSVASSLGALSLCNVADVVLFDQIRADVLDLDRAVALKRMGDRDGAVAVVRRHAHTAIEVAELLHDAGIVAQLPDLVDLLEVVQTATDSAHASAMSADLMAIGDQFDDVSAAEFPFHHDVSMSTPPTMLGPEQAVLDLTELVGAPDQSSEDKLIDKGLMAVWRSERLKRAGEQLPGIGRADAIVLFNGRPESRRIVSLCKEIAGDTVFERLGSVAIFAGAESGLRTVEQYTQPLLAEVLHVLLATRVGLSGALERAVARDAEISNAISVP